MITEPKYPKWTVVGLGASRLFLPAATFRGDVTHLLADGVEYDPTQWVHVVPARRAADAVQWARETYLDHVAGRLDANVVLEVRHGGRFLRPRWRKTATNTGIGTV